MPSSQHAGMGFFFSFFLINCDFSFQFKIVPLIFYLCMFSENELSDGTFGEHFLLLLSSSCQAQSSIHLKFK